MGSLGTGATGGFELPHESWEPNPGPLEEQPVFLIKAIAAASNLYGILHASHNKTEQKPRLPDTGTSQ